MIEIKATPYVYWDSFLGQGNLQFAPSYGETADLDIYTVCKFAEPVCGLLEAKLWSPTHRMFSPLNTVTGLSSNILRSFGCYP